MKKPKTKLPKFVMSLASSMNFLANSYFYYLLKNPALQIFKPSDIPAWLKKLKFGLYLWIFLDLFKKKSKFKSWKYGKFWGQIFQSTGDVAEIHFMYICSMYYVFVGMQKLCSVSRTPPLAHSCVHSLKYTQYILTYILGQ